MRELMTLKSIAIIKIAVCVCNNSDLKKEIMCAPDSDFRNYLSKHSYQRGSSCLQKKWGEILNKKQKSIIERLNLPETYQQQILSNIEPIKLRMLAWAKYIETILGLSFLKYSVDCINSSFFTERGDINTKEAALALVKNEKFEIGQRYKLACLYCLEQSIRSLWEKIPEEEKEDFYHVGGPEELQQPALVNFWSYFLIGKVALVTGDSDPRLYSFDKAIESGNKDAVNYCWDELDPIPIEKERLIVSSALDALRCRKARKNSVLGLLSDHDPDELFAEYYIDILYFLLSHMRLNQKLAFFEAAIQTIYSDSRQANQDYCKDLAISLSEFTSEKERSFLRNDSRASQLFFGTFFSRSKTLFVSGSALPSFTR